MWTCVIDALRDGEEPNLGDFYSDHNDGGYSLRNVSYVNVKKVNGQKVSRWADLRSYARKGEDLLNREIDLLDPHVIVCCGTYQLYADEVCDGDIPSGGQCEPVWDDVNSRVVIDWHHPAGRGSVNGDFWSFKEYCEQRVDLF